MAPAAEASAQAEFAPEAPAPPAPREPSETPEPLPSPQLSAPPHHSEPFTPQPPSASTEVVSEERSEVRSETPSGNSVGSALGAAAPTAGSPTATAPTHRSGSGAGVSLVRAEAVTERRPGPVLGPHPLRMPPGELPGPVVPAPPRRGRRRTALIAATAVVAAGAVVAIVLTTMSGPPDDDKAASSPSASSTSSASSPSPTVEGTSRPRTLPPGAHEEAGGFGWATPTGWRRDVKTGAEVHYTSPDGKQELAAKSSLARGDLMETWETSEQNARQGQDYRKIRLEETEFRGNPAVVWEYTFTLKGVPWHARLLGFNANGKSYQINTWYQPDIESQALKTYDKVKDSFTVL